MKMTLLNTIVNQLSPLENNLSSTVYSIFEKDAIKYIAYMQAI
jgi:PRMT5 arginine-N-methyltransferase